jgi:ribA/ribD-fused uncharacterized protein
MKEKFTFFWSGPYSQWFASEFKIEDEKFATAEQYMMFKKALLFGDEEVANAIMRTNNPKEQKALGRKVKGFEKSVWDEHAKKIVYDGNYAKFTQNPSLMTELMKTKGTTLVESSPVDTIWGIGLHKTDPKAQDRNQWRGTNWLGEVLTNLRNDLISGK